jgi:hypothetical protein
MAMFESDIADVEAAVKRAPSADVSIDFPGAGPIKANGTTVVNAAGLVRPSP